MTPQNCAVIFDWNGTLITDTALMYRATNQTLDLLGKPHVDMPTYRKAYVVPFNLMYNQFGCTDEELKEHNAKIYDTYAHAYLSGEKTVRARRGAREMLSDLKSAGFKTAILSNFLTDKIEALAGRLDLLSHFDAVMANGKTYTETMKRATKGERLRAFIKEHKTQKGIIVGDTVEEIDIAREYGFASIAIEGGVCTPARLRAARPTYQITSLAQIPSIARQLFGKGPQ